MKKSHFIYFAIILAQLILTGSISAQDKQKEMFNNYSKLLSPEKVYLHTDKDVYFATDTIWFSGYVENASYASEFDESNYIYVELITDQIYRDVASWKNFAFYEPSVAVRKKIKRIDNTFSGYIVVPEMNSTGRGIIRAYTYWMLNRPAEYMFYKELELTNPMKDRLVEEMRNKKVKNRTDYLRIGELMPQDSIREDKYKNRYDVQFMPESGNYVIGKSATLYIKSINQGGTGAKVFGEIYNSKGDIIANYSTDTLGFGKAVIKSVHEGILKASVKDTSGHEDDKVELQKAVLRGVIIEGGFEMAQNYGYSDIDRLNFRITISDGLVSQTDDLHVMIHNNSEIYFNRNLKQLSEAYSLQLKSLPAGIHSITVADMAGNVYAERAFLVLPDPERKKLELTADKTIYGKREQVTYKLKLPGNIADSSNVFSVSVYDAGVVENIEQTNIESYMMLKSEVKGYIENIAWYFNDSIPLDARMLGADLLMQTQGWKYYDNEKILQGKSDTPYFGREYKQTLFGKVVNPFRLTKKATVSFVAPSINFSAMGQIDSGYWVLKDVNFPEDTRFIISAIGKNGKSTSHTPILQDDYFAPMYKYPLKGEKVKYTPKYQKIVENIYFNKDDGEHAMAFELSPVVVTSQLITPKNSPSPIPNFPIRRDWYRDTVAMKPYTRSYKLGEYIAETFPGVRYNTGGSLIGPKLSPASGMSKPGRTGAVIVYLNGMSVMREEVWSILQMSLNEIESVIYVSGLSAAPYQTVQTAMDLYPSPVLMVRTKPHVRTDQVPYNVSGGYPLGWQKPARFYSPKYDTPESKKSKEKDNRITLYWNPAVKLDENGEATISFYTSDSDSQYRIEVEGRSAARQYHYAEKIIDRVKESAPAKKK
ncbi:MAG: hypothetical protein IJ476_06680 [Bacteroidales bacterium]|nr:hypothetical protein [Bacteroidales bacterium]